MTPVPTQNDPKSQILNYNMGGKSKANYLSEIVAERYREIIYKKASRLYIPRQKQTRTKSPFAFPPSSHHFRSSDHCSGVESTKQQQMECTNLIISLILIEEEEENKNEERNQRRRERWAGLSVRERDERTRSIPRLSLPQPHQSPWNIAYHSKSERALITLTGLNHDAFEKLHLAFGPLFWAHTPYSDDGSIRCTNETERRGRPRKISSHACLGLVLMWSRTTCQYWVLSGSFGLVGTCCGLWLRFGKRILLTVLSSRPDSQVKLPTAEKVNCYREAIENRYPMLKNVASVGDGLKILLQKAGDDQTQEAFYNGWKSGHYITNLFVFAPDGTIIMSMINCPGSMHDSELAASGSPSIYTKIDILFEDYGVKCVMDSAFANANKPSIIKSKKRETIASSAESREEFEELMGALSVRQAAEWGMRALQGAFGRLKAVWPYEEKDERYWGLALISLLYNFSANNMDLNQIRNVYWKELYGNNNNNNDA